MAQLVYKPGQRKHLYAVRRLRPDPSDAHHYLAGPLVAVYTSTDPSDAGRQAHEDGLVSAPYAVVHVTGYMLALAHQGQEGFRIWVVEADTQVQEQYIVSLVDMVRGEWKVRKTR
jgi:hypothetical protein